MTFIGEVFSFFTNCISRKVVDIQFEKSRKDSETKLKLVYPQLNALCQKEYRHLEDSPIIEILCKRIFTNENTVSQLVVEEDKVVVYYTNESCARIFFRELGVRNLSNRVFTDSTLAGRWNMAGHIEKDSVSRYPYLEFCDPCSQISRTAESYSYSPGFNEQRAIAKIIAQKSHLSFRGPIMCEGVSDKYYARVDFDTLSLRDW